MLIVSKYRTENLTNSLEVRLIILNEMCKHVWTIQVWFDKWKHRKLWKWQVRVTEAKLLCTLFYALSIEQTL